MSATPAVSSSSARAAKIPCLTDVVRARATPRSKIEEVALPVIAMMFEYLYPKEALTARGASTTFAQAFTLWKKTVTVLDIGDCFDTEKLSAFFAAHAFPRVNWLCFHSINNDDLDLQKPLITEISEKCGTITKLYIHDGPSSKDSAWEATVWKTRNLLEVLGQNLEIVTLNSFTGQSYVNREWFHKLCPKVRALYVIGDSLCYYGQMEGFLLPSLVELSVAFVYTDRDEEDLTEKLWEAMSMVVNHFDKPDSKLSKLTLSIREDASYIDGGTIKKLLACKGLKDLAIELRKDCLKYAKDVAQLLEVIKDERLSFYALPEQNDIRDACAEYERTPWDKSAFETDLQLAIKSALENDLRLETDLRLANGDVSVFLA